ncbi:MAG: hypothetical protein IJ064_05450 [Bacteroidaceae bacterium]|nr:hypothetical protein [Bacteroidaceae bacterium]
MAEKIGFKIEGREVLPNGMTKITIGSFDSTKEELQTNELPIILNAIKHSDHLFGPETHVGFDYTLDFPLAKGFGFPYVLDFPLQDESERKLT